MPKCEWCEKEFDTEFAEDTFDIEYPILTYQNIKKCLCGECAIEAMDKLVDGVYYETCERCGKIFDYNIDKTSFDMREEGISLIDCWDKQLLCCECAFELLDDNQLF